MFTYIDHLIKSSAVKSGTSRKRMDDVRCGILVILDIAAERFTLGMKRIVATCCSWGNRYRSGYRPGMRRHV